MAARILLVEDNEANRYLATFILEKAGFEVLAALNGHQALEMTKREMPDLVVMDIQMPEMDGYETASRLKADPATAGIPILGASSFAMAGDREKAMRLGFAGYIEKPINPETFAQEVKAFLQHGGR